MNATKTFGPPPSTEAVDWLVIHRDGEEKTVKAQTAFAAAQAAGWTFDEIAALRPYGIPEAKRFP